MVYYHRRNFVPILLDRVDFLLTSFDSMEHYLRHPCHSGRNCSGNNDAVNDLLRMLYSILFQWRLLKVRI